METKSNKNMSGPLFGAPAAENDMLLADCIVNDQIRRYLNPVIVGRWGTGKSAILIARAKELEDVLANMDRLSKRDWYIREQDLQPESIFQLQKKFSESRESFDITLQRIWKTEIIRRTLIILSKLRNYYKGVSFINDSHWKEISAFASKEQSGESIWTCVESVLNVIFPGKEAGEAVGSFKEFFNEITSSRLFKSIQRCIFDLEKNNLVIPVIGIEPLETPSSYLDSRLSVSQSVVSALLNCFRNDFIQSDVQRIKIFISIPWNRITNEQITFPQHIWPYKEEIRWKKKDLREFINKRIEYEANKRRVQKLHIRPNFDAWDSVFPINIENTNYTDDDMKKENTFDYVCRHTLWRVRDIQTISRDCVEKYCKQKKITVGEFFRKGLKVDEDAIRGAVARNAATNAELRIEEARRKYCFEMDFNTILYGMKVPFSEGDLKKRFQDNRDHADWKETLEILWESGIIGFLVKIYSTSALRSFKTRFGEESLKIVKMREKPELAAGFLFEYNTPSSSRASSIVSLFGDAGKEFSVSIVIHPTFNEYLDLHVNGGYPLGC